ncbi:NAD-dependent epimerase/dehydratase family protein [Massilia horti]|uniref:NAD-dependent epimerase/dehydratase family protein n=1 Tax=Massilia horti TaxID=2562153 RepID=A0A4Y9SQ83_9BURK|nr:NAD-dependent epimerase/dehydratase family protein [Massilia horti]TFW28922.1 NAD-dependent epimerase/dehydratase family protein [Massilia horti]
MKSRNHVVLGTGVLGLAVARYLADQGTTALLVNRSGTPADDWPVHACDASDPKALAKVLTRPTTLYVCAAPPYWRWESEFPLLAEGIARAVTGGDVDIILADNVYAYGPCAGAFREGDPARPCSRKGQVRQAVTERLMGLHGQPGLRVAVVRGATFFGPGVEQSSVGQAVFNSTLDGKTTWILGDPHAAQAYTYVPDFAAAMVELARHSSSFGHVWHAPSHSAASQLAFLETVSGLGEHPLKLRTVGPLMMRCLGLFNPAMRELQEMMYLYDKPWAFSSELTQSTFGIARTPFATAIANTAASARAARTLAMN